VKRALPFAAGLLLCAGAWADGAAADTDKGTGVAGIWSRLWHNDDQRGQQLLNQGDAAAAARTYADPRRKAYAELQAGDYDAAAKGFGTFDDSDAQYNRGNALAQGGDLPEALKAYDAALARDPGNSDARHNRELVEQALRKQQEQQKQGQNSQQQNSEQQDSQQRQDQQQSGQQSQQASSRSGQDQKQDQKTPGSQQDAAQKPQQQSAGAQGQQQPQQQDGNKNQAAGQQAQAQQGQQGDKPQPSAADEAQQAQRDTEAGLHQAQTQQQAGQQAQAGKPEQEARDMQSAPPRTEQQLSQEQWLRNIPDDPGGLLRRKFMLEHKLRQQEQQR
jgi:Ca-activated chloride channel family protein